MSKPPRIAIVGGGPAGLSAAFHLTELPGGRDLDITVYQLGWRLGGKAATGRDPDKSGRIEEHGIHGFCKFYFSAWEMMKKVYAEVGEGGPHAEPRLPVRRIESAFLPSSTVYRVENIDGAWKSELGAMPEGRGRPWDGRPEIGKRAIVVGLLKSLLDRGRPDDPGLFDDFTDLVAAPTTPELAQTASDLHKKLRETYQQAATELEAEDLTGALLEAVMTKAQSALEEAKRWLSSLLRQLEVPGAKLRVQRALTSLDLGLALFRGLVSARFYAPDFDLDDLDAHDYRDWLSDNRAEARTLASASVITVANMLFAYPDGDSTREPELSAASWLNWMLRSVVGRGPYFYFFAAGSGETVTLPLYKALLARGVKFEFFHKLLSVETSGSAGQRILERLVFERQATVAKGSYEPLATMDRGGQGSPWLVWPNRPGWKQLEHGEVNESANVDFEEWEEADRPKGSGERVLVRGAEREGFDYVVWALPSSMIQHVGDMGMLDEWRETVDRLPTTATQAVQLWLTNDTNELGWPRDPLPYETSRYASGSFPNPLSGMAALDDLVRFEDWPDHGPRGLIYLCGQLQDWPGHSTREEDVTRVRQAASATLRLLGNFLTGARLPEADRPDPQAIDFDRLYDPDPSHRGEQRLEFQYARANTRPTEAYVRAPRGSVCGRRDAWGSGYRNLVVAGDWMYNGFNLGSFESAVSGGKLAAFALLGGTQVGDLEAISFLHPRMAERAQAALDEGLVPMIR
jgi:uncharacterized protein with NAD-binding domain and iron-sulfur cluster